MPVLLCAAAAGVALLTGCGQRGPAQVSSGMTGPLATPSTGNSPTTANPDGAVRSNPSSGAARVGTPATSAANPAAAAAGRTAACPVSAPVLLTAAYQAGRNLAHVESEPIDCWHGYAATVLTASGPNGHPGDTGLYVFRAGQGQWKLITTGTVADCTPYIPAAYLGHFPHCR
jgi:hypothetical protein